APEAAETPQALSLRCAGAFTQGGTVLCRSTPGAEIRINGEAVTRADAHGWAVIGFTRDAPGSVEVGARDGAGSVSQTYAIAARQFDMQRGDGLPQQTVTPTDPQGLARIQREAAVQRAGWASAAAINGSLDGR